MHISKILKEKEKCCMDQECYEALTKVRLERAKELVIESKELLEKGAYKSANNRAFYAIEKSIKALLALKQTDVITHNGALKQFNVYYIYNGDGTFTKEDYQMITRADQIRNASDYDDFYVASKEETKQQVENAEKIVEKVSNYIDSLQN